MQVNTNSYVRENPLFYQTTQNQQESATSFEVLLSMQNNQNHAENRESQKANAINLSEFGVSWDSEEGRMVRTAQIVSAIQQYAKEHNTDPLKVNWQRANVSWNQNFANASRTEQKEMLENMLGVLESETAIQRGLYMGETESPAHFEKRKTQAAESLSAMLQNLKV
ncbi:MULTISPECIES: hypothetical protein [Helicobacter]|uniref:hypothetical protein n=1 Tax=Helicobacter TaxID=209 RepID=UPI0026345BC8|nr:hypothetical protein [Helicobacter sp. UBA3407]